MSCLLVALAMLAVNLLGATAVAWDKRRARRRGRRVPERTLYLLGALGAWPLMAVAMALLRHKTRKLRFRLRSMAAALPGTLVLGAAAWWCLA